jgi:hypothetical protein
MSTLSYLTRNIASLQKYRWFNSLLKPFRAFQFLREYGRWMIDGEISTYIDRQISKTLSSKERCLLYIDIISSFFKHGASTPNYFNFEFYRKSDAQRSEFITDGQLRHLLYRFNPIEYYYIFREKYQTYEIFKDYYGRKVIFPASGVPLEDFKAFCKDHDQVFIKPNHLSSGRGAKLVHIDQLTDLDALYQDCIKNKLIIEEVIIQHPDLAAFHPASLNTIRINTVITKEGVRIMTAAFRMGNHGSVIDNFTLGGIFAAICIETGNISTLGVDHSHNWYMKHPMTHSQIKGFHIPKWEAMVDFAKDLALVIPQNRYVGWDISLNNNDELVLVEGNEQALFNIQQAADQIGKKKIYEEALNDI